MFVPWVLIGLVSAFAAGAALSVLWTGRRRADRRSAARTFLLDSGEDPWVIIDEENRILDLNPAAALSLGTTESKARGRPAAAVLSGWPAVQKFGAAPVDRAEVLVNGLVHELTIRTFEVGRVLQLRSAADRRHLQDELGRARQAADSADRAKNQFLATMSHEIRTPLNGVIGFSELLQETPLNPEQQEFVQLTIQSGRSLQIIIEDVLDYSRLQAGQLELEALPVNLVALQDRTLGALKPRAQAKGIELTWSVDPDVPRQIRGDSARITQVLSNLADNAIKFTPRGSVTAKLGAQIVSAVAPPVVILTWEVTDTGIGIAPAALAQLIRPFAQADLSPTRSYGGAGLGLAITRRLCELMGGRLQVVSESGKGSTFTATIQAPVEAPVAAPGPDAVPVSTRPLTVLACEDNEVNRLLLQALLTRRGHRVDFAEDGQAGLERLETGAYDLVFVDLAMPRMDGRQFVRRVREREAERGEPARHLIALTASALQGDRERCLAAGMDDYLTKPLDQPALDQALANFVALRGGATAPLQ